MRVFFLGESFRADAQIWLNGLRTYGNAEIQTWELKPRQGVIGRFLRIRDWFKAIFFLRKKIDAFNADIVIAYRVTSYGFLGARTGKHPFVVSQQGITDVWPPNSVSTPFKAYLGKYALKHADFIHAWGDVMVPAMLELGADPDKILVKPKGVNTDKFSFTLDDKSQEKIIGVVTRSLYDDYRHVTILKAAKILKDKGLPLEINMIGDGALRDQLHQMTKDLGLEDVIIWHGRVPNDQLHQYLRKANIYISTPITEGVSTSLFEAMSAGCLPVITDLEGTRPFIRHGENGYLVPVDDYQGLAEHIEKAWNSKDWMQKAILQNRAYIEEKACLQKNLPEFVRIYQDLIDRSRKS